MNLILNLIVHMYVQKFFTLKTFPFDTTIKTWKVKMHNEIGCFSACIYLYGFDHSRFLFCELTLLQVFFNYMLYGSNWCFVGMYFSTVGFVVTRVQFPWEGQG